MRAGHHRQGNEVRHWLWVSELQPFRCVPVTIDSAVFRLATAVMA